MRCAKSVALPLLMLSIILACAQKGEQIRWAGSLKDALAEAEDSQRHLLVDVYTQTCKWCKALEDTTFTDSSVVAFSREFVWAKVDARADTQTARSFQVFGYPTIILLDPSGQEVDRIVGYLRPEPFMAQIRDYLVGQGTMAALQKQVGEDSTKVQLLFQLGEKYHQRGQWDQSLSLFEKVVRLDPQNQKGFSDDALSSQGDALRRQERTDEAVARFQQLVDRYPESELAEEAPLEIGYTYQRAERKQEAVTAYQAFLRNHPGHQYEEWVNEQLEKLADKPEE
jgi:tetratricopeptide (TPR) repeat protein